LVFDGSTVERGHTLSFFPALSRKMISHDLFASNLKVFCGNIMVLGDWVIGFQKRVEIHWVFDRGRDGSGYPTVPP
jgi:hypothetical protein